MNRSAISQNVTSFHSCSTAMRDCYIRRPSTEFGREILKIKLFSTPIPCHLSLFVCEAETDRHEVILQSSSLSFRSPIHLIHWYICVRAVGAIPHLFAITCVFSPIPRGFTFSQQGLYLTFSLIGKAYRLPMQLNHSCVILVSSIPSSFGEQKN